MLLVLAAGVAVGSVERVRPNDPMFEDQWALENTGQTYRWEEGTPGADIDATRAWSLTTGSRSVVVAILDRGFDSQAEDLAANVWTNPGGVNGCSAGSHGFDEASRACEPNAQGTTHGTGMGWTIGAVGNNGQGLSGVNWTTALMGVTVESEAASVAAGINWIVDAREAGVNVRVINASWGKWFGNDARVRSAIRRAGEVGILFVTGAGNAGEDADADPRYPCNFDLPTLICVAASDNNDELANQSSYGATSVDLAAPGYHICGSPYDSSCAGSISTSDATAFVSGVAALVWSYEPGLSVGEVRSKILGNVDKLDSLEGKVATGGRLNAYRALTGPPSWPAEEDGGGGDTGSGGDGSDGGSGTDAGDSSDGTGDGGSGGSTGGNDDSGGTSGPGTADSSDGGETSPGDGDGGSATKTPDMDRTLRPDDKEGEAAGSEPSVGGGSDDVGVSAPRPAPNVASSPSAAGPSAASPESSEVSEDSSGPVTAAGGETDNPDDGPSRVLVVAMLLAGGLLVWLARKPF